MNTKKQVKLTNSFVYSQGEIVDDWACDTEDGAGVENIVEYEGKRYSVCLLYTSDAADE